VKRLLIRWAAIAWIAGVIVAAVTCAGCRPSDSFEEHAKTAAVYEAELMACVAKASTLAESRACRCEVNKTWGRACVDEIGGKP
jgi:hypothetical protein